MQGRRTRQPEELLEEDCHSQHRFPGVPHHCLLCWVLRFQEQQAGQLVLSLEMRCVILCTDC
jgi:hypothetical protein